MHTPKPSPPGITVACKQTFLETVQVYYANARFVFERAYLARDWASKVDRKYKTLAKKSELVLQLKWNDVGFIYVNI